MPATGYDTAISIITTVSGLLFLYQIFYMVVALIKKTPSFQAKAMHTYAIVISARNEEAVIGNLVRSIFAQDYPGELFHVFVVSDNCTDHTADAARLAGATVYERFDETERGKGYALRYLFRQIDRDYGLDAFDGYVVFDADNLLAPNYLTEINKVFSNGYRICTSYRNSKNFGSNWLTAANGLWFLREARHLNHARMVLGVSCTVSGTGYVVHKDIIKRNGGWNFFLLTEDYDFSIDSILKGEKIGYCESAVFYDEQPTRLADSFTQRLRWTKGFYQVLHKYFGRMIKQLFCKGSFACYDALIILSPGYIFLADVISIGLLLSFQHGFQPLPVLAALPGLLLPPLISSYVMFVGMALLILLTEHRKIYCRTARMLGYILLFPIFLLTYIPIAVIPLFVKIRWKPIQHTCTVDNQQMQEQKKPR